jgi:hypothetical protein
MTAMNIIKPALIVIIAVAVYFIFFANSLPSEIEYRGNTLGPRQAVENNSIKDFEIVSYKDETNYHSLLFLMPEDQSVTTQELLDFYVGNFKAQGFKFTKDGTMHLGLKGDEVIYMTIAANMNATIAYIEKGPNPLPRKPSDASDIFSSLVNFSFK